MKSSLLQFLQDKVSKLPGKHEIDLHVLESVKVPTGMLFPHCDSTYLPTSLDEKITQQDFLATVSLDGILTSAIEAYLFRIPASNKALLYVAKVDASGYAQPGCSITALFTVAFMQYFIELCCRTEFSIHVFARGHPSYLFTASQSNPKKRILSESKLVRWWRSTLGKLTSAKEDFEGKDSEKKKENLPNGDLASNYRSSNQTKMHRIYSIPGYTEAESLAVLPKHTEWSYTVPFISKFNPFLYQDKDRPGPLLSLTVPSFPDDPKGRFLEDLARSAESVSEQSVKDAKERAEHLRKEDIVREPGKKQRKRESEEIDKTSVEEFWQRMGFRSECATVVTGIFAVFFEKNDEIEKHTEEPENFESKQISIALFSRLMSSLLAFNFATEESAKTASSSWTTTVCYNEEKMIAQEGSHKNSNKLHCHLIVDNPDVVRNTAEGLETVVVNVLQPRKKKKTEHAQS